MQDRLDSDVRSWLLDPANPSVRYWTLTGLLDRSGEDPEVAESRLAIPSSEDVLRIFQRQDPAGWWDTPDSAYGIKRTSGQLLVLMYFSVPVNEQARRGCEFILGRPWLPAQQRYVPLCYTANCLRFLTHFGLGEDPRLEDGWNALTRTLQHEGLKCRYKKGPCRWLAIKALWAFAAAEGQDTRAVTRATAEALLSCELDFEGKDARWLRFGFPWYNQSDLLDALGALVVCGYASDSRVHALAQRVRQKAGDDGRWLNEGGSTAVRIERKGQPSKWISLGALRVLKYTGLIWEQDAG